MGVYEGLSFFGKVSEEGIWFALTGKHFKEWSIDLGMDLLMYSDILILGGVVLLFLVMAGSQRAKKWLYWDVIAYLIAKILASVLGGI